MKPTWRTLAIAAIATSAAMLIIFGNWAFTALGLAQAVAVCALIER